ncbi:heat-inducible transcriptional repressor HrcA [Lachnotalea sp. AF33-28]|uniref:heat-inducible transcriptional repressor HrcA n=1 Tax=Lachnotalea sp. AF33-28 TaxID=2292046 RepID=UPI000E4FD4C7|nr:heat-inducible transcriptional repressor HrcA [Lachnotalea sp. AF33-28]RHP33201.1 heat-inducible transcription repressor HrcA [Lachnotalea sp. AF33-28]
MELDERKAKILRAIIQNYQETGEPVGSRTISKFSDLKLSSATIRNEMSDLEELGLIVQPHTSAGRIPTDQGYRLYVNSLMEEKEREVTEMKEFLIQRVDRVEILLKQMAKLLAMNTNYATMISGPSYNSTKLKFIQLSRVDMQKMLAVIVVDGNIVKNTFFDIEEDMTDQELLSLNLLLNSNLNGLTIQEINLGIIKKMEEEAGIHSSVVKHVLDAVADVIRVDDDVQIYTSGTTNIFKYPELSDGQTASELISTFEEKKQLTELVQSTLESEGSHGIQVYIGEEMPVQTMKDCSVVTANYDLGEGIRGTIGIIGPKRMDYEKVLDTLKNLKAQLEGVFKKNDNNP